MEATYCVYKHTCPNGKCYIGITKQNLKNRFHNGHGYDTQLFGRAIQKYGWENITHEILHEGLTLEDAYKLEKESISKFKANNKEYGYNCDNGGAGAEGHVVSEEVRKKQRETAKRLWSDPEKRAILEQHLRELAAQNTGRARPREAIERTISHTSKPVSQFDLDGVFIQDFPSAMSAARSLGKACNSSIIACCKGKLHTAHGYKWQYKVLPEGTDGEAH